MTTLFRDEHCTSATEIAGQADRRQRRLSLVTPNILLTLARDDGQIFSRLAGALPAAPSLRQREKEEQIDADGVMETEGEANTKFVLIKNLRDAGIGPERTPKWFYRRPSFDKLCEFVTKMIEGGHIGLVDGLPGTGKSSTLWWKLQELEKEFLWIHLDRNGGVRNVVRVNVVDSRIERASRMPDNFDTTLQQLHRIPNYDRLQVLVIDGVSHKNYAAAMTGLRRFALEKINIRSGFLTLSNKIRKEHRHQLKILEEAQKCGEDVAQYYFTQHSWTLPEYLNAFAMTDGSPTELFVQASGESGDWGAVDLKGEFRGKGKRQHDGGIKYISVEEATARKYVYAGGSARWMMSETKQSMNDMIEDYLTECIGLEGLVDFTVGEESPFAKTHLYASSEDCHGRTVYSLVSQRATDLAIAKLGSAGTKRLYQHAIRLKNPSFLGWVVEADLMQRCSSGALFLEAKDGSQVKFSDKGEEPTEFDHTALLNGAPIMPMIPPEGKTRVCKPSSWNQGGYDVIFVSARKGNELSLRFGQVTKSATHSLKLHYFAEVVGFFIHAGHQIVSVEIAFITAKQSMDGFRVFPSKVTGRGLLSHADVPGGGKWKKGQEENLVTVYGMDLSRMGYNH